MRRALIGSLVLVLGLVIAPASLVHAQAPASATPSTPGAFVSLSPSRVLDTRVGLGGSSLASQSTLTLAVLGHAGIPATGVSAVVLNVTETNPTAAGYVTAYPYGYLKPGASNLNFVPGQTSPNLVTVQVGTNGEVNLFNGSPGTVDLIADVEGYYLAGTPFAAGAFVPQYPNRLLDTRSGLGGHQIAAQSTLSVKVLGQADVPAGGVSAVVLNLTETNPTAAGYVTAFPAGSSMPTASNLNFVPGQTSPNLVTVQVGANGQIDLFNGSPGTIDLIADVEGYYLSGTPLAAGAFVSQSPRRVLDTRIGLGGSSASPQGALGVDILGHAGVPATGVSAVVLNVTETNPTAAGYVTAFPAGTAMPTASNLNFLPGQTSPNLVTVQVGANGQIDLFDGSPGTIDLVADVEGYYLAPPPPSPTNWTRSQTTQYMALSGNPTSISCPSATFCAMVDSRGAELSFNGTSWTPPQPVDFDAYPMALTSVSCSTATQCVAVDQRGYFATYGGSAWSHPAAARAGDQLTTVACASASFCAAGDATGAVLIFNGTSWTAPTPVVQGGGVLSLACPSATLCLAGDSAGHVYSYNGLNWSGATTVNTEAAGIANNVSSISCASTTFCAAVDGPKAVTFNGAAWSAPTNVNRGSSSLTSVSCVSPTFCLAVDAGDTGWRFDGTSWSSTGRAESYGNFGFVSCGAITECVAVDTSGGSATFNGSTWSQPQSITDPYAESFNSVSCPSATYCSAVEGGRRQVFYSGTTWSSPSAMAQNYLGLYNVSCVSSSWCAAADGYGQLETYNGSAWTVISGVGGGPGMPSCFMDGAHPDCMEIDWSGNESIFYNTSPSTLRWVGVTNRQWSSSCPSNAFCGFVSDHGEFVLYPDPGYTTPIGIDVGGRLNSIACTSSTFCVAVDGSGRALTYNGSSWTAPLTVDPITALVGVSCSSPTACAAVDATGHLVSFDGSTWSAPAALFADGHAHAISCPPGGSWCAVVGDDSGRQVAMTVSHP